MMPQRRNSQLAYPPAMMQAVLDAIVEHKDLIRTRAQKVREQMAAGATQDATLFTTTIPLDLTGLPDHYPKKAMKAVMSAVPLHFLAHQPGDPGGSWTPEPRSRRAIRIYVYGHTIDPDDGNLRGVLRHEMRHMVQTLMGDALRLSGTDSGGGIPRGGWAEAESRLRAEANALWEKQSKLGKRAPARQPLDAAMKLLKSKYGPRYYLDPVEYYTHLGNVRDRLLGGRFDGGEDRFGDPGAGRISDDAFATVVGLNEEPRLENYTQTRVYPLLFWLKRYAPDLYRKAVGDLRAWASAHNAALDANQRSGRALTTSRILSELQDRLDREDPMLAAELRLNRARYEALARSLATR